MTVRSGDRAQFRRVVIGLAAAGLVAFGELYGVQALLPVIARDLAVSAADAALAQSAAALGVALAVVPWSLVARRTGSGPALRVAVVASAVLGLAVSFLPTLELLVAARFVQGAVIAGIPALALVHLGRTLDARHVLAASGWYIAGTSLGGLLGRLVAGFAGDLGGWRAGLVAVSVVSLAAAAVFLVLVPVRGMSAVLQPGHALAGRPPLRRGRVWLLFALAFVLMGCFVSAYNYLGFRLVGPAFDLPDVVIGLVYLAYVFGTVSSALAGGLAVRWGRRTVLLASVALQLAGTALLLSSTLPLTFAGVALLTAGFFSAHSIAAGWAAQLGHGGASAAAGYTLAYYAGAALLGWGSGLVFVGAGWAPLVGVICAGLVVALALSALLPGRTVSASA